MALDACLTPAVSESVKNLLEDFSFLKTQKLVTLSKTSAVKDVEQPSISYQVIRRFILSKGFESSFGLQLLADMLNDILQGRRPNQMSFGFPGKVEKLEECLKQPAADAEAGLHLISEMRPGMGTEKEDSMIRKSSSPDASDTTVLYNMDTCRENDYKKSDCAMNKEDFFSSDSDFVDSSSSFTEGEEGISRRGKRKKASKGKSETEEKKALDDIEAEDKELEKLLRMTDINPNTRPSSSCAEDEKEEKEQKGKKSPKPKEGEVSLMDCLDSENANTSSNVDPKEEDANGGSDVFSTMNSQIKKTFLLSSDENLESSEESEGEPKPKEKELENEKEVKRTAEAKKWRKDDLSEFRVSNLSEAESSEDEKVVGSKEEGSSCKEDEATCNEDSDDSVQCVQHVKKGKRESVQSSENSTDTDSGADIQQVYCKTESSPTKGRKNIKKILKKENLQIETKQALKMETERKKRVNERQKLFEELFPDASAGSKLVLDFDPEMKKELVVVDKNLAQQLKPHQKEGVRFMWNCCFESLKRLEEDSGSGCVLAHCMGLGKTLQVITLIHTILTHNTGVHTVLIMCPLNTIRNWAHEFKMWQKNCEKKIKLILLMQCKTNQNRVGSVRTWTREGGVLLVSYETFRSLIKKDNKASVYTEGFLDPGPDLVVCDEGHVLKNSSSALSKCITRIKTLRRIILTGTPLQNNLTEYYCMVQFVKPNILGTFKEFRNRFVHPISNGQFEDSTQADVRLMKRRAHVLHTMLDGFIQRFGYYVLTPFLPEKQEYAISIALTETQENIYRLSIEKCSKENRGLLKDFHWMQKVWTHPRVILMHSFKNKVGEMAMDRWGKYLRNEDCEDIRSSGKVVLLFNILRRSKEVGDKVLVFSQSLFSLDLIEFFLNKANYEYTRGLKTEIADCWIYGRDYFRLDGSTNSENRDLYCQRFNNVDDERFRLFLVSTKAGGLGINLVAANRVVVFDASWNPTHDVQSIFRVYRFGQKKPCFIYRFLAAATMEEKIYRRQVTKLSLAHRILDEHQIERHYTMGNLQELYTYNPIPKSEWRIPKIPKDNLFAEILSSWRDIIVGYHEHDSLLENKEEEELTEEERKAAWEDFEKEKMTPEYPKMLNGNASPAPPSFSNNINSDDWPVFYKQGVTAPTTCQKVNPTQKDNQMCKIVNVRTLHDVGNTYKGMGKGRLLELGRSFGLQPFMYESPDNYCARVGETLHSIFPWGIPRGMIKGSAKNLNES